jgi:hypothetical protein
LSLPQTLVRWVRECVKHTQPKPLAKILSVLQRIPVKHTVELERVVVYFKVRGSVLWCISR